MKKITYLIMLALTFIMMACSGGGNSVAVPGPGTGGGGGGAPPILPFEPPVEGGVVYENARVWATIEPRSPQNRGLFAELLTNREYQQTCYIEGWYTSLGNYEYLFPFGNQNCNSWNKAYLIQMLQDLDSGEISIMVYGCFYSDCRGLIAVPYSRITSSVGSLNQDGTGLVANFGTNQGTTSKDPDRTGKQTNLFSANGPRDEVLNVELQYGGQRVLTAPLYKIYDPEGCECAEADNLPQL